MYLKLNQHCWSSLLFWNKYILSITWDKTSDLAGGDGGGRFHIESNGCREVIAVLQRNTWRRFMMWPHSDTANVFHLHAVVTNIFFFLTQVGAIGSCQCIMSYTAGCRRPLSANFYQVELVQSLVLTQITVIGCSGKWTSWQKEKPLENRIHLQLFIRHILN